MSPRRGRMPQAVIAATATATELPTSDETVTPVLPNITNESPKIGLPMKKIVRKKKRVLKRTKKR